MEKHGGQAQVDRDHQHQELPFLAPVLQAQMSDDMSEKCPPNKVQSLFLSLSHSQDHVRMRMTYLDVAQYDPHVPVASSLRQVL